MVCGCIVPCSLLLSLSIFASADDPHHQLLLLLLLPRALLLSAFCVSSICALPAISALEKCDAALLLTSPTSLPAASTPPAPLGVAAQSLGHNRSFSHLHSHIHSIICLFACKQTETVRYTGRHNKRQLSPPLSPAHPLLAKFNHVNDVLMGAGQQNKLY